MIVNRAQLAEYMGVSVGTISNWVDKEGLPCLQRGARGSEWQFDSVEVRAWDRNQASGGALNEASEDEKTRARAETRERVAIASLKELELGQRQKVLVHVDDVVRVFNEKLAVFKSRILALPSRLAQAVAVESDPAVCRKLIREEVYQAITSIDTPLTREEAEQVGDSA